MQLRESMELRLQPGATNLTFQQTYFTVKYNYSKTQEEKCRVMLEVCDCIM
jgi:hypothetical protein